MPVVSAGILLYRHSPAGPEVLLVHPGGPFWARKDAGAWSLPKGRVDPGEAPEAAARREFREETGATFDGTLTHLGDFRGSAKTIVAFAGAGDFDPVHLKSESFSMEWPPKSGQIAQFPEADRAAWFGLPEAKAKITKGQATILEAFAAWLPSRTG